MTVLLKQLFNFIKLLNSETGGNQLAAGVVCGMFLGFTPLFSLQSLLVFTCLFLFRIQIGAALITSAFFALLAYLLDPLFHAVGSQVLEAPSLQAIFTTLYNLPLLPFTRFNNSVVMGSGVIALLLSPLVFFGSRILIRLYRRTVVERFKKTLIWKAFTASTLYQWYQKYEAFRG